MHPSRDIIGSKGKELLGKKIALGICGSVAAFKAPELARLLMRHGAEVRAVMTKSATEIISPNLMEWATGNEVIIELTGKIEHVETALWADVILVAPATANTIGKISQGIDDTTVTSLVSVALGLKKPVILVPAMHASMYKHPAVKENLAKIKKMGMVVVEPIVEEEKAKFPPIERIFWHVLCVLTKKDMDGLKVLVTAGPTVEPIDPIKFITNPSSGKMGIAFAKIAAARGAEVTLIYGPGTEPIPEDINVVQVRTTKEMKDAFDRALEEHPDIVVAAAAPLDFEVESPFERKLRHDQPVLLKLKPAPRILDDVKRKVPEAFVVGFKAEYFVSDEELENSGKRKLEEGGLDLVVANDVARPGAGFRADRNEVIIISKNMKSKMSASKEEIAWTVLNIALEELRKRKS
ncbi:MAG: bifunctional phosphopantothenoylcysteine decarboxylase/phosphopantothenate--cysteine ligase CoaBC [Candidatus Hadarchaeales archaeon]